MKASLWLFVLTDSPDVRGARFIATKAYILLLFPLASTDFINLGL